MPRKPIADLEAQVGDSYHVVEDFDIEAGKVEEFARAVGEDSPIHRDADAAAEAGFDAVPAPLTFTQTAKFPRYRPAEHQSGSAAEQSGLLAPFDLGFQWERCVHGEQGYEFERLVSVGDCLSGEITLVDIYQREAEQGGTLTFAVFETEYRDEDGDHVLTERLTVIETPAPTDGGEN